MTAHDSPLDEPTARRPVSDDVSVVIPTVGRAILETCLRHLARGTVWPGAVIVVDQGRRDEVARMMTRLAAAGMTAIYVSSTQRGRAAGINVGLARVRTRFVAITDDDCFVASDWLERLTARLRREPQHIVTGRVEFAGEDGVPFSTVLSRAPKLHTKPRLTVHPFVGGNVGMAMAIVERIGSFDEHPCVASAEDSDYGYRALRHGVAIAYDPGVVVHHYHWRDAGERVTRYGEYARSQGGFYGTHLRSGDLVILAQALRALARGPVRWCRGLVRGDRELAANGRASTMNLLPGIVAGLRRARAGGSPR